MTNNCETVLNLSWITPTLAIGGGVETVDLGRLRRDQAIAAVVDLRSEACDDIDILRQQEIEFLHLPTDDHAAVTSSMLDTGVAFVSRHMAKDGRTLIHCEHGIGRSATLALAVLVAQGLSPLDALTLAKDRRERVSPSPAQYDGWREWLADRQMRRGETWSIPTFETFAAIAYRHLRASPP